MLDNPDDAHKQVNPQKRDTCEKKAIFTADFPTIP
jgi:hypothetical protein